MAQTASMSKACFLDDAGLYGLRRVYDVYFAELVSQSNPVRRAARLRLWRSTRQPRLQTGTECKCCQKGQMHDDQLRNQTQKPRGQFWNRNSGKTEILDEL